MRLFGPECGRRGVRPKLRAGLPEQRLLFPRPLPSALVSHEPGGG